MPKDWIKNFLYLTLVPLFYGCQQPPYFTITENPKNCVVGWGDSMMAGSGTEQSMTEYLSEFLNRETKNFGVGGITSEAVALLQGGTSFMLETEGGEIPKKGYVILHNMGIDPINKLTSSKRLGLLDGIPGELTRVYENEPPYETVHYIFYRGKREPKPDKKESVEFQFKDALEGRSSTAIIWTGRNDSKKGEEIYKIRDNIQCMVDYLKPTDGNAKKVLILAICNGSSKKESKGAIPYNEIMALNNLLKDSFGNNFIDIRTYLVKNALKDLGLKPTPEDIKEIHADCIPKSLRSDEVHLNDNGNKAVAQFLAKMIIERGF